MRYSRRKRNIEWQNDNITREAVEALEQMLDSDEAVVDVRLRPGEGVICNNVLHARTGFDNGDLKGRLMLRIRSYDAVSVQSIPVPATRTDTQPF